MEGIGGGGGAGEDGVEREDKLYYVLNLPLVKD